MKFSLLIIFSICFAAFSCHQETEITELMQNFLEPVDVDTYRIYSMVWSAKYYNPGEQKTFFFALPTTFNTLMQIDRSKSLLSFEMTNTKSSKSQFKLVTDEAQKAEKSSFSKIVTFFDSYSKINLSLDFVTESEYIVENVKIYQNTTFKSIQIKISQPKSKNVRALYVTLDLAKGEVSDDIQKDLADYFTKLQK